MQETELTGNRLRIRQINGIKIIDDSDKYKAGVVAPIVHDGDPVGTVIFIAEPEKSMNEVEQKLAETAAGFLSKALE